MRATAHEARARAAAAEKAVRWRLPCCAHVARADAGPRVQASELEAALRAATRDRDVLAQRAEAAERRLHDVTHAHSTAEAERQQLRAVDAQLQAVRGAARCAVRCALTMHPGDAPPLQEVETEREWREKAQQERDRLREQLTDAKQRCAALEEVR